MNEKILFPLDMPAAEYRKVVAFHEAGHAVASWALELGIREVVVSGRHGHCDQIKDLEALLQEHDRAEAHRRRAIVDLAGMYSQRKFRPEVFIDGAQQDSINADKHIRSIAEESGRDFFEVRDQTHETACEIINENWGAVTAVAEVLFTQNRMAGAQAVAVIEATK